MVHGLSIFGKWNGRKVHTDPLTDLSRVYIQRVPNTNFIRLVRDTGCYRPWSRDKRILAVRWNNGSTGWIPSALGSAAAVPSYLRSR